MAVTMAQILLLLFRLQAHDMVHEITCASPAAEKEVRFILLEQRYLQLVAEGKVTQALRLLRSGLTPLGIHR